MVPYTRLVEFKDYYTTLGVPKTATDTDIKRAYRKLARKYHPDLNPGDKTAEAKFKEINEANEVLGDPEKRKKYDELGANWRMYEQAAQQGGAPPGNVHFEGGWPGGGQGGTTYRTMSAEDMREMFGTDNPFSDFFQTFFGGGFSTGGFSDETASRRARAQRPRRGRDLEQTVDLTLEEAFSGATRRVLIQHPDKPRTIDVRIPAGVKEGARVRSSGEGESVPGGKSGDLFLIVRLLPHPRFERRGQDLYVRVPVPVTTAVLGGEVPVSTISGSTLRLKVPEMTPAGRVFRLRGQGMPVVGRPAERGDLYATADLQIPPTLSPAQRKLYEELKTLES